MLISFVEKGKSPFCPLKAYIDRGVVLKCLQKKKKTKKKLGTIAADRGEND